MENKPTTINEYIALFPKDVQKLLKQVRSTIKKTIPGAEEKISYAIPAFKANGKFVIYFAGFKNHIGVYPAPVNEPAFKKEFAAYKTGKGSVQFSLDKPMPLELIIKIVKFRLKKNAEKEKKK